MKHRGPIGASMHLIHTRPFREKFEPRELNRQSEKWNDLHRSHERCKECDLPVDYPHLFKGRVFHSWCLSILKLKIQKPKPEPDPRLLPDWKEVAMCAKCGNAAPDPVFFHGQPHHRLCAYT